jgi:hypothetical protein
VHAVGVGGIPVTAVWQEPLPEPSVTQPCPIGQAFPHLPQLALSELGSTHAPLHATSPGAHEPEHTPLEHAVAPVQVMPQPPQLCPSLLVGMHWPPQKDW